MTFSDRIETLVGSYPYGTRLEQILDEAARLLIAELPEAMLMSFASEEADNGTTGVDVTNKRIVKAHKNGYPARLIDETLRTRLTNTAEPTPVYYVLNNTAYVKPEGGTITTISFPNIKRSDSTVSGWPTMLVDLLVERAGLLILDLLMVDIREGYGTSVTLPTAPTAPVAPSFSSTDATAVAPSATSISALPTAPVYTEPSLDTEVAAPTVTTLSISESAPSAPFAPDIFYVDAEAATISTTSIAALGTAPAYSKPVFEGSLSIPALPALNLETKIDGTTAKPVPSAPSAPSFAYVNAASATTAATTIASLGSAPTYVKSSDSLDFSEYTSYETSEDSEMMQSILARLNTELSERQADIQNETADFQRQLSEYQQDAAHKIEQARTTLQEALADARSSTDVDVQNQLRAFEAQVQEYQSELSRYQTQLSEYTSDTQAQIEEYQAEFQNAFATWREQQALYLQKYAQDLQNEAAKFQKELAEYQQDAAHKIEQARIALQEALSDAQSSTDVNVRNKAAFLEAAIQDYNLELSLFQAKLGLYQAKVDVELQEYSAALDRQIQLYGTQNSIKIERYGLLLQNARNKFEKELSVYNAGVQLNNLQAEITAREASQTASQATDVALQNKARQLEKEVQEYQSVIAKYQSELQSYSQQVDAALSNQGVVTESVGAKLRMIAFDKDRNESRYSQRFRAFMRAFYPRKSYTIQQHAI
jgi:hypothetical protein